MPYIEGVKLPNIKIDKEALRFEFVDGSVTNLFWVNLFSPMPYQNFQNDTLRNLFKAYNECVKSDKLPDISEQPNIKSEE